ncbi:Alpha/Beta hydrolase protein [Xylariomycetidae sp. FL0641]|nr:Alpha/Beta hydrolase protein [Xylariomycetidae sp. FL0641]
MFSLRGVYALSARRIRPFGRAPSPSSTIVPRVTAGTTLPCRRRLHVEGVMLAPVVFSGLLVALWVWKSFMMVVFQNKIIYMPGLPPNARWETIRDYAARCGGLQWREERARAADGTDLALCVADLELGPEREPSARPDAAFYILYFQGLRCNASSTPPRLPDLSSALSVLKRSTSRGPRTVRCTMVCLSYRGYWTSRGRPTERGIRLDAAAAVDWISQAYRKSYDDEDGDEARPAELVLWGQSIGAGIATNLAAEKPMPDNVRLNSLILETPFTSIRAMLEVLYPQKWLPYKYLWPFLRNHLDSWKNLGTIAKDQKAKSTAPEIFILEAAKDELVPAELSAQLYDRCLQVRLPVTRKAVSGAFHNDALFRGEGRQAVAEFLSRKTMRP